MSEVLDEAFSRLEFIPRELEEQLVSLGDATLQFSCIERRCSVYQGLSLDQYPCIVLVIEDGSQYILKASEASACLLPSGKVVLYVSVTKSGTSHVRMTILSDFTALEGMKALCEFMNPVFPSEKWDWKPDCTENLWSAKGIDNEEDFNDIDIESENEYGNSMFDGLRALEPPPSTSQNNEYQPQLPEGGGFGSTGTDGVGGLVCNAEDKRTSAISSTCGNSTGCLNAPNESDATVVPESPEGDRPPLCSRNGNMQTPYYTGDEKTSVMELPYEVYPLKKLIIEGVGSVDSCVYIEVVHGALKFFIEHSWQSDILKMNEGPLYTKDGITLGELHLQLDDVDEPQPINPENHELYFTLKSAASMRYYALQDGTHFTFSFQEPEDCNTVLRELYNFKFS